MTDQEYDIVRVENYSKDTPEGFTWLTNMSGGLISKKEELQGYIEKFGKENVVTTEPAYDCDGKPWSGTAVHVRRKRKKVV